MSPYLALNWTDKETPNNPQTEQTRNYSCFPRAVGQDSGFVLVQQRADAVCGAAIGQGREGPGPGAPRSSGQRGMSLPSTVTSHAHGLGTHSSAGVQNLAPRAVCYPKSAQALQEDAFWLPHECRHTAHRKISRYQPGEGLWVQLPFWHKTPHFIKEEIPAHQCMAATPRVSHVPRVELTAAPRARKLKFGGCRESQKA